MENTKVLLDVVRTGGLPVVVIHGKHDGLVVGGINNLLNGNSLVFLGRDLVTISVTGTGVTGFSDSNIDITAADTLDSFNLGVNKVTRVTGTACSVKVRVGINADNVNTIRVSTKLRVAGVGRGGFGSSHGAVPTRSTELFLNLLNFAQEGGGVNVVTVDSLVADSDNGEERPVVTIFVAHPVNKLLHTRINGISAQRTDPESLVNFEAEITSSRFNSGDSVAVSIVDSYGLDALCSDS